MSKKNKNKVKLIYNPFAGKKRQLVTLRTNTTLEDICELFEQYQLEADLFPTKYKGHARELAAEAKKEGYEVVVAAGGDGTINEVAQGLVGKEGMLLGILPLGTYMNIARMLAVPMELEKAVMLIKLQRTRQIDVGSIKEIDGDKLKKPFYFLETSGIGLDALLQMEFAQFEKGDIKALFRMVSTFISFYGKTTIITVDGKEVKCKATLIDISNGPYTGAAFNVAPRAKLNDHKLTVVLYKMSKLELLQYFFDIANWKKKIKRKIETHQGDKIQVTSPYKRIVHADASLFGTTPVEYEIVPNALTVICGFPKPDEPQSLERRTALDP